MVNNKVSLFLLGEKAYCTLQAIISNNLSTHISTVIIATDKNVVNDFSAEIQSLCDLEGIEYSFRGMPFELSSEYYFAVGWRWIIDCADETKLIVFHESLLPKYRGFAPLVNQLINGENTIGVTALFALAEFDKGPIITQEKIPIKYPLKVNDAIKIIGPVYGKIAIEIIRSLREGKEILSTPQDESEATYSLWRDNEDYYINWNESSNRIARKIDALGYPYLGARTAVNGKTVIIESVKVIEDVQIENRDVGKVLFVKDEKPMVVCGKGLLQIEEAKYLESNESIIPIKKYRSRFL